MQPSENSAPSIAPTEDIFARFSPEQRAFLEDLGVQTQEDIDLVLSHPELSQMLQTEAQEEKLEQEEEEGISDKHKEIVEETSFQREKTVEQAGIEAAHTSIQIAKDNPTSPQALAAMGKQFEKLGLDTKVEMEVKRENPNALEMQYTRDAVAFTVDVADGAVFDRAGAALDQPEILRRSWKAAFNNPGDTASAIFDGPSLELWQPMIDRALHAADVSDAALYAMRATQALALQCGFDTTQLQLHGIFDRETGALDPVAAVAWARANADAIRTGEETPLRWPDADETQQLAADIDPGASEWRVPETLPVAA